MTKLYKPVPTYPNPSITSEIDKCVWAHGPLQKLSPASIELLTRKNPRTSSFYLIPKSTNLVTRRTELKLPHWNYIWFCRWIPLNNSWKLLYFILQEFPKPLPPNTLLVTMDIIFLYANTLHANVLMTLEYFLFHRPPNFFQTSNCLIGLTQFIVTRNYLAFQGSTTIK